jgi:hypothetical protein
VSHRTCAWVSSAVVFLASTGARAARTDDKEQCISAAEQGQDLRDDNKYQLARHAFSRCEQASCPALVRQDCTQWLQELDDKTPTIVLAAQDAGGHDLTEVKVTVDGALVVSLLDGMPLSIDPGEHLLRYEAAGFTAVEDHIVIRAGQKNRILSVQFGGKSQLEPAAAAGAPDVVQPETPAESPRPQLPAPSVTRVTRATPSPAAWAFGGLALAAFGSEAYFALTAIAERNADLAPGACAPHCGQSEKSSIWSKAVLSDVSLGVGIASAGLAAYFFFLSPRGPTGRVGRVATTVDFAPRPGGGVASFTGGF